MKEDQYYEELMDKSRGETVFMELKIDKSKDGCGETERRIWMKGSFGSNECDMIVGTPERDVHMIGV